MASQTQREQLERLYHAAHGARNTFLSLFLKVRARALSNAAPCLTSPFPAHPQLHRASRINYPPPPPPRPIPRPRVSPLPRAVQHTVSKFSAAAPPIRHKTSPHRAPPAPRGRTHDARSGAAGLPVHHARDTHHFATTPIGSTGDQAFSVAFLLRSPSYTTPPPLPFAGHKYPKVRRALSDAARSVHARCCLGAGAATAQANLNPI